MTKCSVCGDLDKFLIAQAMTTPVPCKKCGRHMDIHNATVEATETRPALAKSDPTAELRLPYSSGGKRQRYQNVGRMEERSRASEVPVIAAQAMPHPVLSRNGLELVAECQLDGLVQREHALVGDCALILCPIA
jgi:hypothetical protein